VKKIRIATRKSNLALWQAKHVAELLHRLFPELDVELVPLSTRGDEILDRSLDKVGGKGLFIKELEHAMLRGEAEIAVHSMKDVPSEMPKGFCIAAVLGREQPFDALVSHNLNLSQLPTGSIVGTSSQRRAAQVLSRRPDLKIKPIRGNVESRLQKWQAREFDAIILAQAGLIRLGLQEHITQVLSPALSVPAVAQGIIGIECLSDAKEVKSILQQLNDLQASVELKAERAFNRILGGDCHSPVAAFARFEASNLKLMGLVASTDGRKIVRVQKTIQFLPETNSTQLLHQANELGELLGKEAISLGAAELF